MTLQSAGYYHYKWNKLGVNPASPVCSKLSRKPSPEIYLAGFYIIIEEYFGWIKRVFWEHEIKSASDWRFVQIEELCSIKYFHTVKYEIKHFPLTFLVPIRNGSVKVDSELRVSSHSSVIPDHVRQTLLESNGTNREGFIFDKISVKGECHALLFFFSFFFSLQPFLTLSFRKSTLIRIEGSVSPISFFGQF